MKFGLGFIASKAAALPVVGTYRNRAASTSIANCVIGDASPNRLVVVVGINLTTGSQGTLSCTIGGVAATLVTELKSKGATSIWQCASVFALMVPTGTTATCTITNAGGTVNRSHIAVWTIDNAKAVTPDASVTVDISDQSSGGAKNITLPGVKASSAVILFGNTYTSAALTHTWSSPVVTDFNAAYNTNSKASGALRSEATAGDKTYTNTVSSTTSLLSGCLLAASWG